MKMDTCPYCNVSLKRTIKQRTDCPSCNRPILIYQGRLWTLDEMDAVDWCKKFNIDKSELYRTRENLSVQFGCPSSYSDAIWRLMHKKLEQSTSWGERKLVYLNMASILWKEKRDHLQVAQEAVRMDIADWEQAIKQGLLESDNWGVKIINVKDKNCCPRCRSIAGRVFTFKEFVERMPVPVPDCTSGKDAGRPRGSCRCSYRLIRR